MLDRIHGEIYFECDECGETLETGTKDFQEALAELRKAGWVALKGARSGAVEDVEWAHYCPECK